jgi:hypothetical protein
VDRFEIEGIALLHGQVVRVKILGHHPCGATAEIADHDRVGTSIDVTAQFGSTAGNDAEVKALYPPVGAEVDAVVIVPRS